MAKPPRTDRPPGLKQRLLRGVINVALILHLTAVIIAPASVSPSSELIRSTWNVFRPYLQLMFLNHGYHFFAPQPGNSTLLGYKVELKDGTTFEERIPNRDIKPRLLYHRHFMLTEFLGYAPPPVAREWHRNYANHLIHKYDAQRVSLYQVTHYLPMMETVRDGVTLDAPESYEEIPLGTFECDDF